MVRLSGGDVDVSTGSAFRSSEILPLVRLTTTSEGQSVIVWLGPNEARAVGLDLIAAASAAMSDAGIREYARANGLDGDSIIGAVRGVTTKVLGPG